MIVKDEAHVIGRCLGSVLPFIDHWVIVDTGSSDGTQQLIRELLADLPGQLHERPWKDFGHNRSEALELARADIDAGDYILIIDADEEWLPEPGFSWPKLTADIYQVLHHSGSSGTTFYLNQLVRAGLPARYVGVLHEVLSCDEPHRVEKLEGVAIAGHFDSARNKDPDAKYRRDAKVLEAALEQEPNNLRYLFYLAQSYRDSNQLASAIDAYRRRAEAGGWEEEVWYSLFQVGVLEERAGHFPRAVAAHLEAYAKRPTRAEPLVALARLHREREQWAPAHLFAERALNTPEPDDILFLDTAAYRWRALDEYAIASFWVGEYAASLKAHDELLKNPNLPRDQRSRVERNREFCVQKLGA